MLKVKAKIYQYTGIFLANKEQTDYLWSAEGLAEIQKSFDALNDAELAFDLTVGSWQADHGFTRPLSEYMFKRPYWLYRPIIAIDTFLIVLVRDIKALLARKD